MIEIVDKDRGRIKLNPRHVYSVRLHPRQEGTERRAISISTASWIFMEEFPDGIKANLKIMEIEEAVDKANGVKPE